MRMAVVMLFLVAVQGAAQAQTLEACRAIADEKARLACYEKLAPQTKTVPKRAAPKEDVVITQAKAAVAKKLKDPTSPLFTELKRAKRPNLKGELVDSVCGFVNAKNSYGGYVGAKPFYYDTRDGSVALVDGSQADLYMYGTIYKNMCK